MGLTVGGYQWLQRTWITRERSWEEKIFHWPGVSHFRRPKRMPVFCEVSGLIWLDKANPEPKNLLPGRVKDEKQGVPLSLQSMWRSTIFPHP